MGRPHDRRSVPAKVPHAIQILDGMELKVANKAEFLAIFLEWTFVNCRNHEMDAGYSAKLPARTGGRA
jgi:hypothetical protein